MHFAGSSRRLHVGAIEPYTCMHVLRYRPRLIVIIIIVSKQQHHRIMTANTLVFLHRVGSRLYLVPPVLHFTKQACSHHWRAMLMLLEPPVSQLGPSECGHENLLRHANLNPASHYRTCATDRPTTP
jgi:hypothetical protein